MRMPTPLQVDFPGETNSYRRAFAGNLRCRARTRIQSAVLGLAMALLVAAPNVFAQNLRATETEIVDVIFVLDNSGSMRENDPLFLTRKAVSNFASALARDKTVDGQIAVILFGGKARLVRGLTRLEAGQTDALLGAALVELDYSGQRTNSPAGIERALYEFSQNGRENARRAIILLSDGKIDTGSAQKDIEASRWLREDLATESEASGVRIFGVAFTEAADYQLMQALANRTHARYYRAFEASQLTTVVEDVLARVAEEDSGNLALADVAALGNADTELPPNPPPVSSAPTTQADDSSNLGLLALLPVVLLLAGGALLWHQRATQPSIAAPPAQLLDVGGHLGNPGEVIELSETITRIGRDPHNDIVLNDETISSEHAVIEITAGRYWIEDQRSTNGTYVGEERIAPGERVQLKGGDHIRLSDIDLMFVMTGYMPGGATVFLSTPTSPPAWREEDAVENVGPEPAIDTPPVKKSQVAKIDSAEFAPSLDHDSGHDQRDDSEAALRPEQQSKHGPDDQRVENTGRRVQLSLLRTPEDEAEHEPEVDQPARKEGSSEQIARFRQSLDYHLGMVSEISPAFASFIERAFDEELRSALVVSARELTATANAAGRIQQKQYSLDHIRFVICAVPGEMADACAHFAESFGGFTRLLTEHLQSESFRKDRCETLAVLTTGCGESPWVSLSIVPDDGQDPRIDLLSYEFLTPQERQEIESNEFVEVSHSGFA